MYRAVCDVCGKDDGSDFYAWADRSQARESWDDGDCGVHLDDDRIYCHECIPAEVCRYSDGEHTPSDDGLTCIECIAVLPVPARAEQSE